MELLDAFLKKKYIRPPELSECEIQMFRLRLAQDP
jgi:hypothetical protein